ncbi:hypothetical protein ScPMuIL_012674 [Solemya velum]
MTFVVSSKDVECLPAAEDKLVNAAGQQDGFAVTLYKREDRIKVPIECYECLAHSSNHYCADPFNKSHPDLKLKTCFGYCVKWFRVPKTGAVRYRRTCSTNLRIGLRISMVCMQESRPSAGHLCFCDRDMCNRAGTTVSTFALIAILFLSYLFGTHFASAHTMVWQDLTTSYAV